MIKIRLHRTGRKNDPHFRLVATPHTLKQKTTNHLEILGTYDVKSGTFECKADRVQYWISVGAKATDTAHNLLISKGVITGKKINALPRKTPVKKDTK
jgi:small subunit ribosomal protein S16